MTTGSFPVHNINADGSVQFVVTGERETGEYQCEASTDTGNVHAAFYGNLEFKRSENALPYRKCRQIKETLFFKGRLTNEISQSCLSILSSLDFFFRIQI